MKRSDSSLSSSVPSPPPLPPVLQYRPPPLKSPAVMIRLDGFDREPVHQPSQSPTVPIRHKNS
ncbi:hypothetical protein TIFTF001_035375 [Ficus carica]|uniref:Uncharacterized protein n=1 Tax=Ficus carica TaxID=3494 RepID=A0AA88J9M9_FICCA|nr:hypothetical protein TIFTF001_035375 [Ficus carica]